MTHKLIEVLPVNLLSAELLSVMSLWIMGPGYKLNPQQCTC